MQVEAWDSLHGGCGALVGVELHAHRPHVRGYRLDTLQEVLQGVSHHEQVVNVGLNEVPRGLCNAFICWSAASEWILCRVAFLWYAAGGHAARASYQGFAALTCFPLSVGYFSGGPIPAWEGCRCPTTGARDSFAVSRWSKHCPRPLRTLSRRSADRRSPARALRRVCPARWVRRLTGRGGRALCQAGTGGEDPQGGSRGWLLPPSLWRQGGVVESSGLGSGPYRAPQCAMPRVQTPSCRHHDSRGPLTRNASSQCRDG